MEFRPLRRIGQAVDPAVCEATLASAPRGVLAVHGENGYPYGLPVDHLYLDGKIYFHCARAGHKLDAMRANDKVCFTICSEPAKNPGEWWNTFTSVICFGHASEVTDDREKERILRLLAARHYPEERIVEETLAKHARNALVFRIDVDHMSGKRVREK